MQLTSFVFLLKFVEMIWSHKKCQKVGVGMGLGQVRTKKLLAQTISDKIFGTKWSNPVKLDRKKKIGIGFCMLFNCYWQSLSS